MLHYIRIWDLRTANAVDVFVANSEYVARRIQKTYRRPAHVIYPPVDTETFRLNSGDREGYYIVVSRIVPYKKVSMIVEAFTRMPHRRLLVVGSGPGRGECEQMAGPNVEFLGYQTTEGLRTLIGKARAFVFAAEEDFGIAVVEAQSCGTPVICYGKGGATETVLPDETGTMFSEQTPESLCKAVDRFEEQDKFFQPRRIRQNAERFSVEVFRQQFDALVNSTWPSQAEPHLAHDAHAVSV
jgi:glycosyltransferase involved in cell wall biosynthesis